MLYSMESAGRILWVEVKKLCGISSIWL